jgi:hypothetical protein
VSSSACELRGWSHCLWTLRPGGRFRPWATARKCSCGPRICFNAAVSNIDDHPRNHALLARSTSWQLSPAYGLAMACGLVDRSPSRAFLYPGLELDPELMG